MEDNGEVEHNSVSGSGSGDENNPILEENSDLEDHVEMEQSSDENDEAREDDSEDYYSMEAVIQRSKQDRDAEDVTELVLDLCKIEKKEAPPDGSSVCGERAGRSAALERAYVHDVYDQCEEPTAPARPRITQFLSELELGAIVCDVGCGGGRYLQVDNPGIFIVGAERCARLSNVAASKGGQVTICDNLELPYRDESYDAVLSVSVIHHFATTERRVLAIRELARVLRIGGRLIISVWAMEQKQRRFESQDVLVPWRSPKPRPDGQPEEEHDPEMDIPPPYTSCIEDKDITRRGSNSFKNSTETSPDAASLSSPGETCYSFVRRAIQKLAGGKRMAANRPWFIDTNGTTKPTKNPDACEDATDFPIELRRLEDIDDLIEPPLSAGLKSRSLGDILAPVPREMVRSRSSVPVLGTQISETPMASEPRRRKLVKQKQSLQEESEDDVNEFFCEVADSRAPSLRKQSSLNEELMSTSRLRDKQRVRKRIQKQTSLNEAFLCRSIFVGGAAKRLQMLREGLSTRIKTSTGSLERVTKNSLARILQGWKNNQMTSQDSPMSPTSTSSPPPLTPPLSNITFARRLSREDGSDSSKDSSLQSDTSVDSEDSFASVIYNPKPGQYEESNGEDSRAQTPNTPLSPGPENISPRSKTSPVPTSPLVKTMPNIPKSDQAEEIHEDYSRVQIPNTPLSPVPENISPRSKTSPISTTPLVKTMTLPSPPKTPEVDDFYAINKPNVIVNKESIIDTPKRKSIVIPMPLQLPPRPPAKQVELLKGTSNMTRGPIIDRQKEKPVPVTSTPLNLSLRAPPNYSCRRLDFVVKKGPAIDIEKDIPPIASREAVNLVKSKPSYEMNTKQPPLCVTNKYDIRRQTIKEEHILNYDDTKIINDQKKQRRITYDDVKNLTIPKFKHKFGPPLVRHGTGRNSRLRPLSRQMLFELTLDLFNPETDDVDSDSSEPSSPDSVESVIQVFPDIKPNENDVVDAIPKDEVDANPNDLVGGKPNDEMDAKPNDVVEAKVDDLVDAKPDYFVDSRPSDVVDAEPNDLVEAVARVTSSLENAVGVAIRCEKKKDAYKLDIIQEADNINKIKGDESCRRHLQNFADDISKLLLKEFEDDDRKVKMVENRHANDPYLKRLNGEIRDLSLLSEDLKQRKMILESLSKNDSVASPTTSTAPPPPVTAPPLTSGSSVDSSSQHSTTSTASLETLNANENALNAEKEDSSPDSPTSGGSATHHRYYHVFTEGELESLIARHVANLHIVSSFYESSCWCVVAEKVKVWTI